jgi:hypothetical protein
MVRIGSTVTAALMRWRQGRATALLWDAVRVMTRLLPGGGAAGRRRCVTAGAWPKRCAGSPTAARTAGGGFRKLIAATHATRAALLRPPSG